MNTIIKTLNILIDELLNYFQIINYNNDLFNEIKNNKEILLNNIILYNKKEIEEIKKRL